MMEEEDHAPNSANDGSLSFDGARQLVDQAIRLGFFHSDDNTSSLHFEEIDRDDSLHAFRKWQKDPPPVHSADGHCQIIPTTAIEKDHDDHVLCYTIDGVVQALHHILDHDCEGRSSRLDLGQRLRIDPWYLTDSASPVLCRLPSTMIQLLGQNHNATRTTTTETTTTDDTVVSSVYWKRLQTELLEQVNHQDQVDLLKASSQYSVPMSAFLQHCIHPLLKQKQQQKEHHLTLLSSPSQLLASHRFIDRMRTDVLTFFASVKEPTSIATVCRREQQSSSSNCTSTGKWWDVDLIVTWLQEGLSASCSDDTEHEKDDSTLSLAGELQLDVNHATTAIFLPQCYQDQQRQQVLEFVSTNGYVTTERAHQYGLSMTQAIQMVRINENKQQLNQDNTVLLLLNETKDMFVCDMLIQRFQACLVECQSTEGIVDLVEQDLPADVIRRDVLSDMLNHCDDNKKQKDIALVLGAPGTAMLIHSAWIKHIQSNVLQPLIDEYAHKKAQELFDTPISMPDNAAIESDDEDLPPAGRGKKGKSRKSRKSKRTEKQSSSHASMERFDVPLLAVAGAILKTSSAIQKRTVEQDLLDHADQLSWEDDETHSLVVLDLCKKFLVTEKHQDQYRKAIQAELTRLNSSLQSKATVSRKDAAAKVRSVESAFEDGFVQSCYMIQTCSKFLTLASASNHFDADSIDRYKQEFLVGACANLTSRVTQYCLFKSETDETFGFKHPDDGDGRSNDHENSLPGCCLPVDTSTRRFPKSYLTIPSGDPLPLLRDTLSGNNGVVLARQWILCGGDCYLGGVVVSEDGNSHKRPGNLDGYLTHVEENCLTLCGLPFKKIDKKSEKHFLFARRQTLTKKLEATAEAEEVLEYTIMILFQQVKQSLVTGSQLRGPILHMLAEERKMPSTAAYWMKRLDEQIRDDQVNLEVMEAIRACGLSKDISKFDIESLSGISSKYEA